MAENLAQWKALVTDGSVLECRYEDDPNVLVAGDVLVYRALGTGRMAASNARGDPFTAFWARSAHRWRGT